MIFRLLQIWKLKLHKKKVTHVEFNSRCEWLLATASVDQTVKIWDLRNIKDKANFLHVLPHDKPVNAGEFLRGFCCMYVCWVSHPCIFLAFFFIWVCIRIILDSVLLLFYKSMSWYSHFGASLNTIRCKLFKFHVIFKCKHQTLNYLRVLWEKVNVNTNMVNLLGFFFFFFTFWVNYS